METFHLKEHSYSCACKTPYEERKIINTDSYWEKSIYEMRYVCEKTPQRFFFQLNGKFYMIVYYSCVTLGDFSGYFTDLLNRSIKDVKDKRLSRVKKSIPLDDLIKKMKQGDFLFKNYHEEIVHIYEGNFKVPQYCIIHKTDYFNTIFSNIEFNENYQKALQFLKDNNIYERYYNEIHQLYKYNLIPKNYLHNREYYAIQTTNLLITQINKIANGND
jgi:hypothetical protein